MCFLENSKLRITLSNFFQNCSMCKKYYLTIFQSFSSYYSLIIPNILLTYVSDGGAKESRTPDLLLARQAL